MQHFSGFEYLLIDVANQYGLDKLLFDERIAWATEHLDELESLADQAETKPLYLKACHTIRKAQKGLPTGHLVGFDACCSGIQIMSAITGCEVGATNTGLVDPNKRADAYNETTQIMQGFLGNDFHVERKDAKNALMTSFYGSKRRPIAIFGENTPELNAFYQAAATVAPGAWALLQTLLASWQPNALFHAWKLPDGFDARIKVMAPISEIKGKPLRITIDELDHASCSYEYYENVCLPKGHHRSKSNAANVVHSIDAYVLRSIHRRCNYDPVVVKKAKEAITSELFLRAEGYTSPVDRIDNKVGYYVEQYERSGMADVVILPYLEDGKDTQYLSTPHLERLLNIIEAMEQHAPFEVITIHDEFRCHANNMNHLRYWYKELMAELAESNILSDILSQIHGFQGTYPKLSDTLGDKIRGSNYALS